MWNVRVTRLALAALLVVAAGTASRSQSPQDPEVRAAWVAAARTGKAGPAEVPLLDQATLKVPQGQFYVPADASAQLLRASGNVPPAGLVGMVVSTNKKAAWYTSISFARSGYVRDDDAKVWKADDLLADLRAMNVEANKERLARGVPEVDLVGWAERPRYDETAHQLVWSLMSRDKGVRDISGAGAEYNGFALGREGYFTFDLVTTNDRLEVEKPIANTLLASLTFNAGKRYDDVVVGTDQVSERGLAFLVGGVSMTKPGLVSLLAAYLAKSAKLIAWIGVAVMLGATLVVMRTTRRPTQSA